MPERVQFIDIQLFDPLRGRCSIGNITTGFHPWLFNFNSFGVFQQTLTKRYGWGIHFNSEGKVALYPMDSDEYKQLVNDKNIKVIKAMRNKKL